MQFAYCETYYTFMNVHTFLVNSTTITTVQFYAIITEVNCADLSKSMLTLTRTYAHECRATAGKA